MSETKDKQSYSFQAEVNQVLHLMIHSLYSNKEIFLRELVSNASDAADKLRFKAIENNDFYENDNELKVWIDFDKEARTITVRDNGIGMTKEEMISNLGTIAKSGTKEFLNNLSQNQTKASELIGQFGVGFYSSFVVADEVQVISRKAGADSSTGHKWTSKGDGSFTVEAVSGETSRGTSITLHLKPEEDELLSEWRLKSIVKKYSDHISIPVVMKTTTTEEKDKPAEIKEEVVNQAKALWTRNKSEIKEEDYKEFYKQSCHDYEDPLTWAHNKVEGKFEYTTLLYIPKKAPFDLFHANKTRGLKLFVQRVFIMDDAEQFLPNYLRFVRGIIDSNDLPLNVSREILQSSKVVDSIKNSVVKRVLEMLNKISQENPDKYAEFWKEFGQVLKEGPAEDFANREDILKLLRFSSTFTDNSTPSVSLEDYLSRMKPEQETIYYIVGESFASVKNSPHLEVFRKNNIEVLLLTDRVDEWLMGNLFDFKGKKFQSATSAELDKKLFSNEKPKVSKEDNNLIAKIKSALGEELVKDVKASTRLTNSPACVVSDNTMSPHMEKLMRQMGHAMPISKPVLEINLSHPILSKIQNIADDELFKEWSLLLLEQSLIASGAQVENPSEFINRVNKLLTA